MTLRTVACQAPFSMVFSRQKHRSRLTCPSLEDLPGTGIEPASTSLVGTSFVTEPPGLVTYDIARTLSTVSLQVESYG